MSKTFLRKPCRRGKTVSKIASACLAAVQNGVSCALLTLMLDSNLDVAQRLERNSMVLIAITVFRLKPSAQSICCTVSERTLLSECCEVKGGMEWAKLRMLIKLDDAFQYATARPTLVTAFVAMLHRHKFRCPQFAESLSSPSHLSMGTAPSIVRILYGHRSWTSL